MTLLEQSLAETCELPPQSHETRISFLTQKNKTDNRSALHWEIHVIDISHGKAQLDIVWHSTTNPFPVSRSMATDYVTEAKFINVSTIRGTHLAFVA